MHPLLTLSLIASLSLAKTCKQKSTLSKDVDKILTTYVDSGFSGTALVVQNNKVVLDNGYGFADRDKKTAITPETLFNVASIGKQFTAVIVLKLEEQGLLNIKDPVSKYTGSLGADKDNATIENLLLHNSGLFKQGYEFDYTSRDKYIASIKNAVAENKPGENYRYSNAGYSLLAGIAEIVTKKPFEQVLKEMIFQPAGMTYTGYPWERHVRKELLATGYNNKGVAQPAEPDIWGNRGPGNLVTNSIDMLKWSKALANEKIVSKAMREKMFSDPIPGKETFTWNKMTTNGKFILTKGGGRPDFESQSIWMPKERIYIFFSINSDQNLRRFIYRDIMAYLSR